MPKILCALADALELLDKVQLKLSLCDTDDKFEKQVNALLVPVLCKLSSPDGAVKTKATEVLSYISKV